MLFVYPALVLQYKLEKHSIEVHNSRRPLDCLTLTLTFDLIFIGGRGIVMDYPCAKFGDFNLSRFGFIVRTDRQTESQRRMIDTHATTVGVSNKPMYEIISAKIEGCYACAVRSE